MWRCTGASVQGQGHARRGVVCQDAQGWAWFDDVVILAVGDGAGSAACAERGSTVAVETVLNALASAMFGIRRLTAGSESWAAVLRIAFGLAHKALEDIARNESLPLREFATTLLVCVATRNVTVGAQIGDGAIVCSAGGSSEVAMLTSPTRGEYVNETEFLTQPDYLDRMQVNVVNGPATELALFSDGFEPVAITWATGEVNQRLFEQLFCFMRQTSSVDVRVEAVKQMLAGERLAERSDDDKTLLLATRRQTTEGKPIPCA